MSHPSKRKGVGFEREVVNVLQEAGIEARRVPLSGAVGGAYSGDIDLQVRGSRNKIECKRRAREFSRLYGYLADNYAVIVRDDKTPPLVVMRLVHWMELIR